jgi:hypothetical protein
MFGANLEKSGDEEIFKITVTESKEGEQEVNESENQMS